MKRHAFALALALVVVSPTAHAASEDDADLRLFKAQQTIATKGDPTAQYYLGEMYEHGLGTPMDLKQAFEQYEKSATKNNALAKRKLAQRKQIEESASRTATPEKSLREQEARRAAEPPKPAGAAKNVAEPPKAKTADELAAEAAAREKLRAQLRAQLRERAKNPVGEPFE
jgi:TPR repeat protein